MSTSTVWIPSATPFFFFGLLYYLISPVFVFPLLATESDLFFAATHYMTDSHFNSDYGLDVVVIFVSFYIGYSTAKATTNSAFSDLDYGSFQAKTPLFFVFVFMVLIIYFLLIALQTGGGFFTGYSGYDVSILGAFSTLVFLSAWFVNFFSARNIRVLFFSFFTACSTLLLGWGSRMYFVLGFVALLLGLISHRREILKSVSFYFFVLFVGVFIVFVGVLRHGGTELTSENLLEIVFAEPLFTSVSGFLFLENSGGRPAYNIPHGLLASMIHFVPSFLFPEKMQLIGDLTLDENIVSPFGGTALIVNLYSNFGMFYPIFVFALGAYYGFLFVKSHYSVFYKAIYFSALPVLLFLFFRDGITTVMKVLFFNGFIVPYLVAKTLIVHSTLTRPDGLR